MDDVWIAVNEMHTKRSEDSALIPQKHHRAQTIATAQREHKNQTIEYDANSQWHHNAPSHPQTRSNPITKRYIFDHVSLFSPNLSLISDLTRALILLISSVYRLSASFSLEESGRLSTSLRRVSSRSILSCQRFSLSLEMGTTGSLFV
jgi:hypothetical protein